MQAHRAATICKGSTVSIPSMQYKRWTHDRLAQTHLVRQNASATRLGRLGEFQAEFSRVRVVVERLVVHDRARGLREGISVNQARSAVALWRNAGNELLPQRMHRQSLSRVLFSTFHRAHPLESLLLVCRSRWIRSSPLCTSRVELTSSQVECEGVGRFHLRQVGVVLDRFRVCRKNDQLVSRGRGERLTRRRRSADSRPSPRPRRLPGPSSSSMQDPHRTSPRFRASTSSSCPSPCSPWTPPHSKSAGGSPCRKGGSEQTCAPEASSRWPSL